MLLWKRRRIHLIVSPRFSGSLKNLKAEERIFEQDFHDPIYILVVTKMN
jgi:hypothetical protein